MKILVTGYKGFIGRNLIKALQMHEVVGLELEDFYNDDNWQDVLQSLLNKHNPDTILHVGACSDTLEQDVNYMMAVNYEATKVLVDWCTANRAMIVYSSSAANTGVNGRNPSNLYGWSKYAAEDYVVGRGGIALRYYNVYGPGEDDKGRMASVAYQSFSKHRLNTPITLFPGAPRRDFVYVGDVVNANVYAFAYYDELCGKYYEVGSGQANTFEAVLEELQLPFSYAPESVIPKGYQFNTLSKKERWMPGWSPRYTLQKGLQEYKIYLNQL